MYVIIIVSLLLVFLSISFLISQKTGNPTKNSFSIIIPCRNEEDNLPQLLMSLNNLQYPDDLYEIIFIDDASSDRTADLLTEFVRNLSNCHIIPIEQKSEEYKGKKFALKKGIEYTQCDHLLFTDADCQVPSNWIDSFNDYIAPDVGMVVGYSPEKNVSTFRRFSQILTADFYCATIHCGLPFSANGRNLYINKDAYMQVDGFEKIKKYTCAEDKLLLNLIRKTNYKIMYNSDSKVYTNPQILNYANQQKRRYGQLSLSSPLYKLLSMLIFFFYIYLPIRVLIFRDWIGLAIYFSAFLLFWIAGLIRHKERFHVCDILYILIYPYYLIYFSLLGMFGKWTWK